MIKIIADSGSTKTDWVINSSEYSQEIQTLGMNPYTNSESSLRETIVNFKEGIDVHFEDEIQIYFYGAGCASSESKRLIAKSLSEQFPNAQIKVEHDLLAAARSACGTSPGLTAILGTGSNTCLYDGSDIVENRKALGFILGDEGSGSYIGKRVLRDYLNEKMPADLHSSFEGYLGLTDHQIFKKVYQDIQPNRFLASHTKWLTEYVNTEYAQEILDDAFSDLFEGHITKYSDYQKYSLNVVGSIGAVFYEELKKVADKYQTTIGKVIKSPIEGLVEFHS